MLASPLLRPPRTYSLTFQPCPTCRRLCASARALPPPRRPQVVQPLLPSTAFRVYTSLVRGLNNLVGGVSFGLLVKALGVQKAADAAPAPAPPGKGKKAPAKVK